MQFGFKSTFEDPNTGLKTKKNNDFVMVMESVKGKEQPEKQIKQKTEKQQKTNKKFVVIHIRKYFTMLLTLLGQGLAWCRKALCRAGVLLCGAAVQAKEWFYAIGQKATPSPEDAPPSEAEESKTIQNKQSVGFQRTRMKWLWRKTSRNMRNQLDFARTYARDVKNRPVIAMAATVTAVAMVLAVLGMNYSVAFEVVADAKTVAVVHSQKEYREALNVVNTELESYFGEGSQINKTVAVVPCLVKRNDFSSDEEVKNAVRMLSDRMVDAYMVYVEDKPLFAMNSQEEINLALEKFKACYTGGAADVQTELDKPVAVKEETVPAIMVRDVDGAVNHLNGSERKDLEYTIVSGDNLWRISRKFEISIDQLYSINPGLTENIKDGQKILVKAYVPIVDVKTVQQAKYVQSIPYETQVVEDNGSYKGTSRIDQQGQNGEEEVVANVIKKNGMEVNREIISSRVISEPVKMVKVVGTQKPPSGYGTGKFVLPTYGTISSRFGPRRSGYHKGLDIAAATGTPIRAADNGKVTQAGWQSLFGNLVILDHGNGYETYYGHCSKLAVKVGQTVNQGEIIAYVGSTGNSTGPHCHFEVHYYGQLKNPESLPYK